MATIATGGKELQGTKMAPVATAYAVLMNAHSDKLSAWHRMTTIVAIKGHLEDSVSVLIKIYKCILCYSPEHKVLRVSYCYQPLPMDVLVHSSTR
ncbi:hypothetical protein DPMN_055915 [Dreissena polymorpha]|uniref:Uncharacterized protein n=1 Tax=Dreissena polymorpha TaxID=45954 RepID=A0A9D4CSN4_DREPO|nr:hypothetical protein DPMN_055915 [Dreissena polymorpha]